MALPNEIHPFAIAGGGNQYQVANSLRFRASNSAYLSRTFGTPTAQNTWTLSFWLKRGKLSTQQTIFSAGTSSRLEIIFASNDTLQIADASTNFIITTPVYRDPSSWYHVVIRANGSGSAMQVYINGIVTTNSTTNNLTTSYWNASGVTGYVGSLGGFSSNYLDGYLTEVNFVDGQSLDPTYFGQTDSITNQWVPKKYTGTYGTNGFYLPFNTPVTSSYGGSFNGSSQYLQATLPSTLTGAFTIEYFLYRGSSGNQFMFTLGDSATSTGFECYIGSTGTVLNALWGGSSKITATGTTTAIPTSTWSHIALTRDASNNVRMFLNGAQVGSTVSNTNAIDTTLRIGVEYFSGSISGYLNGSLSNFRIINGTCLYTSNFNVPAQALIALSGTSILTLQSATVVDNSGNALSITNNGTVTMSAATPWTNFLAGQDSSGNGNGWTSSGISITSGSTYDVMIDSPTDYNDGGNNRGNYCTFNPAATSSRVTLSNGSLTATKDSFVDWNTTLSTYMVSSGKWYYEFLLGTTTNKYFIIGYVKPNFGWWNLSQYPGNASGSYGLDCDTGNKRTGDVSTSYGSAFVSADIAQVALDLDNGKIWWGKNGTWFASGDPAAGTNAAYTSVTGPLIPALGMYTSETGSINFGQRPFSYTPPSGFKTLNSYNLANPSLPLV